MSTVRIYRKNSCIVLNPKPEDFDRAYIVLLAIFIGTVIWSLLSR